MNLVRVIVHVDGVSRRWCLEARRHESAPPLILGLAFDEAVVSLPIDVPGTGGGGFAACARCPEGVVTIKPFAIVVEGRVTSLHGKAIGRFRGHGAKQDRSRYGYVRL